MKPQVYYYAIGDVVLIDTCHSSTPYPAGTYRSNYGATTTLQGTNFVQRNMNALNISTRCQLV